MPLLPAAIGHRSSMIIPVIDHGHPVIDIRIIMYKFEAMSGKELFPDFLILTPKIEGFG